MCDSAHSLVSMVIPEVRPRASRKTPALRIHDAVRPDVRPMLSCARRSCEFAVLSVRVSASKAPSFSWWGALGGQDLAFKKIKGYAKYICTGERAHIFSNVGVLRKHRTHENSKCTLSLCRAIQCAAEADMFTLACDNAAKVFSVLRS